MSRYAEENKRKDLRFCKHHSVERTEKPIQYESLDGSRKSFSYSFLAPVQTGKNGFHNFSPSSLSKGNGNDRAIARTAKKMIEECGGRAVLPEVILQERESFDINPTIKYICGIIDAKDDENVPASMTNNNTKKREDNSKIAVFTLQNLVPKEVKRMTGFHDLFCLLSYVAIICGGDINLITSLSSKMTWLEEWIFYFEFIYGHSKNRWCDYASAYKLHENHCRKVFKCNLNIAIDACNWWPMYLSHEEDCRFRKK